MSAIELIITEEKLSKVLPKLSPSEITGWVNAFRKACHKYSLTTVNRVASLIGQAIIESNGLKTLEENLKYTSASRLLEIFKSDFKDEEDAKAYVNKPEKIANRVYANQGGNGDEESGDGWRYRGRGIGQLTLKGNYLPYFKSQGLPLDTNPDILLTKEYAVDSFAWYFRKNNLYKYCDIWDIKTLTKKINAASLHLKERIEMCNKVKEILMYEELG